MNNNETAICACIERLLKSATNREPEGNIMDVLRRIVQAAARRYLEFGKEPICAGYIEQHSLALWSVLSSNKIGAFLGNEEVVVPGVPTGTSRIAFVTRYATEFVVETPMPGVSAGSSPGNGSSRVALLQRFEEFLVGIVLFHLIEESGAWLSMSVAVSMLFVFFDALSISCQEPVCRDLLQAMVVVDDAYMDSYGDSLR